MAFKKTQLIVESIHLMAQLRPERKACISKIIKTFLSLKGVNINSCNKSCMCQGVCVCVCVCHILLLLLDEETVNKYVPCLIPGPW